MNIAVFLAIGETWEEFQKKGQDQLLLNNNLKYYSLHFENVFVFHYGKFSGKILPNIRILPNKYRFHRYLYSFIMPLFYTREIKQCSVIRCMQMTGAIPGLVIKIFFGKKLVFNYGYDYEKTAIIERKYIQAFGYKLFNKMLLPSADAVIFTNKTILAKFNCKKVYIPNSIDVNLFKPDKLVKKIDILYVGRLEKQKNLFLLLSAVKQIKRKLDVVFIGSGSLNRQLEKHATEQKINLRIMSNIANNLLPEYYNQARIFVLPSFIEGHPKALLEAMSCAVAVIGTDVEGIRDLIINNINGLLIKTDVYSLRKSIIKLMDNEELRNRLGKEARNTIINKYSAEIIWIKEIELLKSLSSYDSLV